MPRARHSLDSSGELGPSGGMGPHGRAEYYDQSRPGWQQPQPQQQQGNLPGSYSPGSRMMGPGMFGQQGGQGQAQEHHFDYPTQQEQQAAAGAAAMAHQQDQRGVSQLQGAASAASAGLTRPSLLQVSAASQQGPSLTQPMNNLAGVGTGMLQGSQDLTKRGPVEFNHAISYVNKIKVGTEQPSPLFDKPTDIEIFDRTALQVRLRSTNNSLRYYRLISASPNQSGMCMPRSPSSSIRLPICWKTSSNFSLNLQRTQSSRPQLDRQRKQLP